MLVAAGWDKDRARELRGGYSDDVRSCTILKGLRVVSPSTYTTFYLGALSNSEEFKSDVRRSGLLKQMLLFTISPLGQRTTAL